jgi:hypothetical protein
LALRHEAQQLQPTSSPLLGFASSPPTYKKLLQLATGVVSELKNNPKRFNQVPFGSDPVYSQPRPFFDYADPGCGTGGFLLAA